jgi:flagellar biosynthesis/type III secretory pathway protein FliH
MDTPQPVPGFEVKPPADAAFAALFVARPGSADFGAGWPPRQPPGAPSAPPSGLRPPSPLEAAHGPGRDAEQVLAEARAEAERLVAERVQSATAEVRGQETAAFRQASQELLQELRTRWEERLGDLEREAAVLVTDIARRILHDHFAADEGAILPVVREALQRLADSARVRVVVAPSHEATVRRARHELAAALAEDARLEIVVDEMMVPGGCLAHGDNASVDARLDTRLEAFDQAIRDVVA